MIGLVAALAAGATALLVAGPTAPPRVAAWRRSQPVTTSADRRVGAEMLLAPGAGLRRLLGGRADSRLDRRAGAVVLVAFGAWLVGPVPALTAAGAWLVAARWRVLRQARRTTATDVARDLPDVVDLLSLAVGAGLSVPAAVPVIASLSPATVRADLLAASDALAGGRASDDVVVELGRCWGPPARPLVHALADHLRYGTPVLPSLERVGAEARAARRRAAEARARRLPVLLLFPLVLCTLPAFGVLTVAPLVASTFDSLRGGHLEAPASIAPR